MENAPFVVEDDPVHEEMIARRTRARAKSNRSTLKFSSDALPVFVANATPDLWLND